MADKKITVIVVGGGVIAKKISELEIEVSSVAADKILSICPTEMDAKMMNHMVAPDSPKTDRSRIAEKWRGEGKRKMRTKQWR